VGVPVPEDKCILPEVARFVNLFWSAAIHRRFLSFGCGQLRKAAMNRRTPKLDTALWWGYYYPL
jgi:hypothetical protein